MQVPHAQQTSSLHGVAGSQRTWTFHACTLLLPQDHHVMAQLSPNTGCVGHQQKSGCETNDRLTALLSADPEMVPAASLPT